MTKINRSYCNVSRWFRADKTPPNSERNPATIKGNDAPKKTTGEVHASKKRTEAAPKRTTSPPPMRGHRKVAQTKPAKPTQGAAFGKFCHHTTPPLAIAPTPERTAKPPQTTVIKTRSPRAVINITRANRALRNTAEPNAYQPPD